MTSLIRFGVSLEKTLLEKFDALIAEKQYTNRSEAIRDLIRESLVKKEWEANKDITGAITLAYDHHKRELVNHLMNIQHDYHDTIISTQHIHLDHHNCMEVLVVKGKSRNAETLFHKLKSAKGVKHAGFTITTTGKDLM
jgi:CopG family transcriptional regulator, nickel-responsive regulator